MAAVHHGMAKQSWRSHRADVGPWLLACLCWLGALTQIWGLVTDYNRVASRFASAPAQFPFESTISFTSGRSNILLFLDPMCETTAADLDALNQLMHTVGYHAQALVILRRGVTADMPWQALALPHRVKATPQTQIMVLKNNLELQRFGVINSGVLLLYSPTAELKFSGGVSNGRNVFGVSVSSHTLEERITDPSLATTTRPVYGCDM